MNEDIVIYDYTIRIGNKILYDVNEDIIKLLRQLQQENQQLKEKNESMLKDLKVAEFQINLHKVLVPECIYEEVKKQRDLYKSVIDEARELLTQGITFCENDSQGVYEVCKITINREKKALEILNKTKVGDIK